MITLSHADREHRALIDKPVPEESPPFSDAKVSSSPRNHTSTRPGTTSMLPLTLSMLLTTPSSKELENCFPGTAQHVTIGKSFITLLVHGTKEDPEACVWGPPVDWKLVEAARVGQKRRGRQNEKLPQSPIHQSMPELQEPERNANSGESGQTERIQQLEAGIDGLERQNTNSRGDVH